MGATKKSPDRRYPARSTASGNHWCTAICHLLIGGGRSTKAKADINAATVPYLRAAEYPRLHATTAKYAV
jgi:hypothetical protein